MVAEQLFHAHALGDGVLVHRRTSRFPGEGDVERLQHLPRGGGVGRVIYTAWRAWKVPGDKAAGLRAFFGGFWRWCWMRCCRVGRGSS